MKRQILRCVLGLLYMASMIMLLLSQMTETDGLGGRWQAALGGVLIGIPWLMVLKLYVRVAKKDDCLGKEAAQTGGYRQETVQAVEQDAAEQEPQKKMPNANIRVARATFETAVVEYGLTDREREVAWLLYRGYTNRQIGEDLFIAETTVKKHVSHIYEKAQVMGRKEFRAKMDAS